MPTFINSGTEILADAYSVASLNIHRATTSAIDSSFSVSIHIGKVLDTKDPITGYNNFDAYQQAEAVSASLGTWQVWLENAVTDGKITQAQADAFIAMLLAADAYIIDKAEQVVEMAKTLGKARIPSRVVKVS